MSVASEAPIVFRTAVAEDRAAVFALVERGAASSPTHAATHYFLELAFGHATDDARLIVADLDGDVAGFVLFGDVAGSVGAARLHRIAVATPVPDGGVGVRLCESAITDIRARHRRVVVAELPDHTSSVDDRTLLERCGFSESGRVRDYYRDGVDLVVLQRFLDPSLP